MKAFVFLLLSILLFSCNGEKVDNHTPGSNDISKKDSITDINELILVKPNNITLEYSLDKNYEDTIMGKWGKLDDQSSRLTCIIKNNSNSSVFLVGYSCSDLPGKLEIGPKDKFYDWQFVNCNVSWPVIYEISPNEHKEFSTNVRAKENLEIERLGMYIKCVDRWIESDTLRTNENLIKSVISTPYEKCSFLKGNHNEK